MASIDRQKGLVRGQRETPAPKLTRTYSLPDSWPSRGSNQTRSIMHHARSKLRKNEKLQGRGWPCVPLARHTGKYYNVPHQNVIDLDATGKPDFPFPQVKLISFLSQFIAVAVRTSASSSSPSSSHTAIIADSAAAALIPGHSPRYSVHEDATELGDVPWQGFSPLLHTMAKFLIIPRIGCSRHMMCGTATRF
jgi:hypothetical protein